MNSSAQKKDYVTGKVLDSETGLPVVDISVVCYTQNNIVYRTASDSLGVFKTPTRLADGLDSIKLTSFTYKTYVIKKKQGEGLYKNGSFGDFKLKSVIVQLSEVKVKANKRYRDTTKIDLSDQKFERNIMIDDLFSQYGFSKDSNGQLYYKGKPIGDIMVNGGDFFGKNNKEVYSLLPALVLDNIEVVETNIDSTTNTTTLKPIIKINLKFKEQYKKGKFGNASTGLGTEKRYLAGVGLYTYKNKEQVSLAFNSNNININNLPLAEPPISFSANGNNVKDNIAKLTYNNTIAKKIEIDLSASGKLETRTFISESERQDQAIDQYSKTTSISNSKLYGLSDAKLNLLYKIDSLNILQLSQVNDYNNTNQIDSTKYLIKSPNSTFISDLSRKQQIINQSSITDLTYKRLFSSKKGRYINITLSRSNIENKNIELDNIYSLSDAGQKQYYVDGKKINNTSLYTITSDFTEPISDESYINIYSSYKNDDVNYTSNLTSDSLANFSNSPVDITNQYVQSGVKLQKTFDKVSFDGFITALFNNRSSVANSMGNNLSFFNINLGFKADYKLNSDKGILIDYSTQTNYPEVTQLININTSYDLISQMSGNLNLKPEIKNNFRISFSAKKTMLGSMRVDGEINYYRSKFGLVTNISANTPQNIYFDNIGNAFAAALTTSFINNIANKLNFNYTIVLNYQELPTIVNNKFSLNNSFTINQTISTNKELIKNILTVSPTFTGVYNKYYYGASSYNTYNLTYSDKFTLAVAGFKMDLYPLLTYNHSISSLTSFSMNAGVRRTVFGSGAVWVQGYDIFNSFKFNNNSFGPTYVQTIKYSNVNRYFILGLSFKFNNIK